MSGRNLPNQLLMGLLFLMVLLAGPPLGVVISGDNPLPYLGLPSVEGHDVDASFSWAAFAGLLLFIVIAVRPFLIRMFRGSWKPRMVSGGRFPLWGWAAAAGTILFWVAAWSRPSFLESIQRFTFFPLWFCFIITLNALAHRISGRCLMADRPLYFALLFPSSGAFWWFFEYLNRFIGNWQYTGVADIGSLQYFLEASLSFSTVLPAVLSIRFLLLRIPVFREAFVDFPTMPWLNSNRFWNLTALLSAAALVGIGWKPSLTYPLLWIAPGLLLVAFQRWAGYSDPILRQVQRGNMTLLWASAAAALLCGFFWEMWNYYSLAKWTYSIPGVAGFHLFEMPLLGYAGYLPFGILCALAGHWLQEWIPGMNHTETMSE